MNVLSVVAGLATRGLDPSSDLLLGPPGRGLGFPAAGGPAGSAGPSVFGSIAGLLA